MNKRTLKALKGSIKKWQDIVDGIGTGESGGNCPLCQLSYDCDGCPVMEKSGLEHCHGTPYIDWDDHQYEAHLKETVAKVYCPTCKKLAIKELNFLKSLLPKPIIHYQTKVFQFDVYLCHQTSVGFPNKMTRTQKLVTCKKCLRMLKRMEANK